MAGILLASGQHFIVDLLADYSGLYAGLMINSGVIAENAQLGVSLPDLVELDSGTSVGYARKEITAWTKGGTATDPTISSNQMAWVVSGTWPQVNGYFVAKSSAEGTYDAIWAEVFPSAQQGDKLNGDQILLTAIYEQKDDAE